MSRPAPIALGIDVGGTKTLFAIVDVTSGGIAEQHRIDTPQGGPSDAEFLQRVETVARELVASSGGGSVSAVGLGICELVDRHGEIKSGHRVHWQGLPVRAKLGAIAPAVVEADVRAAALAEVHFGAGRDYRDFLYVNIGTGISTCLVIDREPFAGAHGNALVIASAPSTMLCPDCGHLRDLVLEDFAGGAGLAARYREKSGVASAAASDVLARAEAGDPLARQVIDEAAVLLGSALGMAIGMFDPEALIVGGGLGSSGGFYWERLESEIRRHVWSAETRGLAIRQAELKTRAGVIGAALAGYRAQTISSPKLR
ncbi:MAG: ROK family protein [Rhizobiales bacterium]|nr:ROK family protein [Hyphomicrobiales bacterium]